MSVSPLSEPSTTAPPPAVPFQPLRYWPALLLAALIWVVRFVPTLFPESGFAGFLIMAMGPLACGLLILLWWIFLSRATRREKIIGTLAIVAFSVLSNVLADKSMQGFGFMLYGAPRAFTAFAVVTALLSRARPAVRTGWSLLASGLLFASILPLRTEGVSGDMQAETSWRWEPTKTERIVEKLKGQGTAGGSAEEVASWSPEGPVAWGEFRGPHRDGKVPGVTLVSDWKAHPPQELWKRPIGPGWGSFIVVGDRIFTQEQRGEEEMVVAYEAATGKQIWTHADQAHFNETVGGSGPRGTPTFHAGRLYTMGAKGAVDCLDAATGKLLWTRDLTADSGAQPPTWGFSSSPLIAGNLVLVHAGGTGVKDVDPETKLAPKGLVAYDLETGDIRWTAPAGEHGYSSPQILASADGQGEPSILMLSNSGLAAHSLQTGEVLWSNPWAVDMYRVVQPLAVGPASFLIGTTMGGGTRRIDISVVDGKYEVHEAWTTTAMKPYFNDYVEHKGYLYGFDHDIFACIDLATGKRIWKKGRYGNGQVLLLPDGDQLLIQAESGEVVLLAADPKGHRELGSFPAIKGKTWNHPVLVGNRLYVRNGDEAACYELAVVASPSASPAAADEPAPNPPAGEAAGGE